MPEKECFKCNVTKPLSEFYAHKAMADNHLNKCKECTKTDVREYTQTEAGRATARRANQKSMKAISARARVWANKFPEKRKAQHAVNNAIRDGKLEKNTMCSSCGDENKHIHGHHADYNKPLEVVWLCPSCHRYAHKAYAWG